MKDTVRKYEKTYQELPQIPAIKKLWFSGYWDGPLNGACEVNGQKCWFEMIEQYEDYHEFPDDEDFEAPWYRRYLIVRLTEEQFQRLEKDHDKFRRMVGSHCDYDEEGKRKPRFPDGNTITQETQAQYYAEAKIGREFVLEPASEDCVLGWYED